MTNDKSSLNNISLKNSEIDIESFTNAIKMDPSKTQTPPAQTTTAPTKTPPTGAQAMKSKIKI